VIPEKVPEIVVPIEVSRIVDQRWIALQIAVYPRVITQKPAEIRHAAAGPVTIPIVIGPGNIGGANQDGRRR
jgi:hypothetical protein